MTLLRITTDEDTWVESMEAFHVACKKVQAAVSTVKVVAAVICHK
jgi:hypothetical protein